MKPLETDKTVSFAMILVMKFMTYNIYNGAVNTLDSVIRAINHENPDVLALNEANGFNDVGKLKQFALDTNFQYYELIKCGDGDDYHVALLSKLPFTSIQDIQPLARAAILALVNSPEMGEIAVVATHLSPYSEDARMNEANLITKALEPYDNKIVMGDMNSISSIDDYPRDLLDSFNQGQLRKFTTDHKLRFDVMSHFENAGLIDAAVLTSKNSETTVPTPVNIDVEHSDLRLDYILLSSNIRQNIKHYSVIKNSDTKQASDHYPVCIEI